MITTIVGESTFMVKTHLKKQITEFVATFGDFGLEQFDGDENTPEAIRAALQSLPFLSSKKLVVIRNFANNKPLLDEIEHIFDTPDSIDVILVAIKPDRRTKVYKLLKAKTQFIECNLLEENQLAGWLVEQAREAGGSLGRTDALYLIQRVGSNQQLLYNEMQKLLTFNPQVSRNDIEKLCDPLPQGTVFELLDSAFAGNYKRAMQLYEDQRKQRVEPLAILGMIGWQLHILATIAASKSKQPSNIASEAGLHPFVVNKSQKTAVRLGLRRLKELVYGALDLDIRLKSQSINPDDALKQYLLGL